jgi:hypothetical protein
MSICSINADITMEVMMCVTCGATFTVPMVVITEKRKRGGTFYCPNGHPQTFGETELDRLRKSEATLRSEKWNLEKRARSAERQLRRLQKPKKKKPK